MASEQAAAGANGRRWMTRRRAWILALILTLLGAVAAWALTRPEEVAVPQVTEENVVEAQNLLEEAGLEVKTLPRPFCEPPDTVVEQNPGAGESVEEGSTVTITVSTGSEVRVPDVAGEKQVDAAKRLQKAQLLPRARQQFSDAAKPGAVIGTRPSAGTEVDCQSRVTMFVSRGKNVVTLPSVIGFQREEAESELEQLGFIVDVDTRDADQPEGEVIGQQPGPDSRLPKGDTVTIIVSTGAGSVIVPSVEGQSEDGAKANLVERGLSVVVQETETDEESEDGRVLDQAPDAGTRVRMGDQVTIVVGRFEEPPPEEEEPTTTTSTTSTTSTTEEP
jgi:serine/threonine-protein kinase